MSQLLSGWISPSLYYSMFHRIYWTKMDRCYVVSGWIDFLPGQHVLDSRADSSRINLIASEGSEFRLDNISL